MPLSAHQVIITDPVAIKKTIDAMVELQDRNPEKFSMALLRLMSLFSDHLAVETPSDRRRMATLWANPHEDHDFFWFIREEPMDSSSPDQSVKRILAGGLHRHDDTTWSINT